MIVSESWDPVLFPTESSLGEIKQRLEWLEEARSTFTVYPARGKEFEAFRLTPFDKVKVVIMGQDPYPGTDSRGIPHAHGLAFSSQASQVPKSLQNIFKEITNEFGRGSRTNADLSDWAEQGVLLLNASLTVKAGKPNSHTNMWEPTIKRAIEEVSKAHDGLVFMLWGNDALQIYPYIKNKQKHLILEAVHPSPMSAYRGFFGCGHFIQANRWLDGRDKDPIYWI